ncbi:MAG: Gfo/Idh/MocA family oxidoreductase [Dehalococcoidia bacterium]|nr:Gfo/Idh/MocA family oxidoreductase [Dehalococcoidia bacterium]
MKKRVAVIGLGKMALLHASILATMRSVELVAFCEISSMVRRFGKRIIPGIEIVRDLGDLRSLRLDAVYVTTPASSHFPIVKAIYADSIAQHLFVEKPLASSYSEAQELCNLAQSHGGVNMVGYNRRFSVTFGKGRHILDEGTIGTLTSFEGYAYSSDFFGAKAASTASSRGGVISDLGCHVVDLALWFFGGLEVQSTKLESLLGGNSEDAASFRLKSNEGVNGVVEISWCKGDYRMPEIGLKVTGSKGNMKVDEDKVQLNLDNGNSYLWHKHDLGDDVPFFIGGTDYVREDELFLRSVSAGTCAEPSFQTASEVERVIAHVKKASNEQE